MEGRDEIAIEDGRGNGELYIKTWIISGFLRVRNSAFITRRNNVNEQTAEDEKTANCRKRGLKGLLAVPGI